MSKETIRTSNGHVIGYINEDSSGQTASSETGRILGYWSKTNKRTTTNTGRVVSEGNTLSGLIWSDAHSRGKC